MTNNTAYASVEDLIKFWRALTPEEIERAELLLSLASTKLRQMAKNVNKDLDDLIASGVIMPDSVKLVVLSAVKRAMISVDDAQSVTQAAGTYSVSTTYANPQGNLYFTKSETNGLGLGGGTQNIGSISMTESSIY